MYHRITTALSAAALCLLLTGHVPGQQPEGPPPDGGKPGAGKDGPPSQKPAEVGDKPLPPPEGHDPTQAGGSLRNVLGKAKGPGNTTAAKLPLISIRGRVIAKDKPPAVLLEVDGKVYRVTKGSLMNGPGNTTLRVTELTRTEVKIQVNPQNDSTVLETIVLQ
jgi:hypothetical protein